MSINHNWFNGANISSFVWKGLSEAYDQVRKEISDCEGTASEEEFEKMCQVNLSPLFSSTIKPLTIEIYLVLKLMGDWQNF